MIICFYTSTHELGSFLSIYINACKHRESQLEDQDYLQRIIYLTFFFLQNTKIVVLHEYIIYEKKCVFTELNLKTFRILPSTDLRNQFCFASCLLSPIGGKPFFLLIKSYSQQVTFYRNKIRQCLSYKSSFCK